MWIKTAGFIRDAVWKVLRVLKESFRGKKWVWWWNEEVKERFRIKNVVYVKFMDSKTEEKKVVNKVLYKIKRIW